MSNTSRNVLAVIAGVVVGAVVNGLLITVSPSLIPPPEGVDVTNTEALKAGIHLFEPRHFVMPWLAHALGTLVGAFATFRLAASHQSRLAYLIGAYFPMAWLATRLGGRNQPQAA